MIGAGARIGPHAVIGRNARVAAGAAVERAIVWPSSAVDGAIASAIVTPHTVVGVDRPIPP